MLIAPAMRASARTRTPMMAWSVRFMRYPIAPRATAARGPGSGGHDQEGHQREEHEQDEQDDRELPQPALDTAAAAVDRRVTAERAGQPGAPGLEQDRGDEADADDDLADRQGWIHAGNLRDGTAGDGITRHLRDRPAADRGARRRLSPPSAATRPARGSSVRRP